MKRIFLLTLIISTMFSINTFAMDYKGSLDSSWKDLNDDQGRKNFDKYAMAVLALWYENKDLLMEELKKTYFTTNFFDRTPFTAKALVIRFLQSAWNLDFKKEEDQKEFFNFFINGAHKSIADKDMNSQEKAEMLKVLSYPLLDPRLSEISKLFLSYQNSFDSSESELDQFKRKNSLNAKIEEIISKISDKAKFLEEIKNTVAYFVFKNFFETTFEKIINVKEAWSKLNTYKISAENPNVRELQKFYLEKSELRLISQLNSIDQNEPKFGDPQCSFFSVHNLLLVKRLIENDSEKINDSLTPYILTKREDVNLKKKLGDPEVILGFINEGIPLLTKKFGSSNPQKEDDKKSFINFILDPKERENKQFKFFKDNEIKEIYLFEQPFNAIDGKSLTVEIFLKAVKAFNGVPFLSKVEQFRQNGSPIYLVFFIKGHFFAIVMTKFGMFIADSEHNQPRIDTSYIKAIYDYFLFGMTSFQRPPTARRLKHSESL